MVIYLIYLIVLLLLPDSAFASGSEGGHSDPFSAVLLTLAAITIAAVLGRWLARLTNQASVLGELVIGVILGNVLYWLGQPVAVLVMHLDRVTEIIHKIYDDGFSVIAACEAVFSKEELMPGGVGSLILDIVNGTGAYQAVLMMLGLWMFSNLGVIILLFMVGLENSVDDMMKVGVRSLLVAIVGVVAPFLMGYGISLVLLPDLGMPAHLFIAATLCATSVGITARVFKDLGQLRSGEARVILGAAVIDDILGLIILAIVVGIVATGHIDPVHIAKISIFSLLFLVPLILWGEQILHRAIATAARLRPPQIKLLFPLTLAFVLSWAASAIGLASIVGAFAAGLIVQEAHFEKHSDWKVTIDQIVMPLESLFAPVFFVMMGMQVNLASFMEFSTISLAVAFTVIAIVGKIVSGLPAGSGVDKLSVGIGMIPRGEVGLIFASIGKGLGVVSDGVFSAIVIMVVVSTLITPPALNWSLARAQARKEQEEELAELQNVANG